MIDYKIAIPTTGVLSNLKVLSLLKAHKIEKKNIYIFVEPSEYETYNYKLSLEYNIVEGRNCISKQRECISDYFSTNEFVVVIDESVEDIIEHNNPILNLDIFISDTFKFLIANNLTLSGIFPEENPFETKKTIATDLVECCSKFKCYINKKQLEKRDYQLLHNTENTIRHYMYNGGIMRYNYIVTLPSASNKVNHIHRFFKKEYNNFLKEYKGYCITTPNNISNSIQLIKIPKREIIQSLWIGKTLNEISSLCIDSWLKLDYEVHLFIDDIFLLPKYLNSYKESGQLQFYKAKEILSYNSGEEILPFSDLFRYKLLYVNGGTWLDTDMFLLKRLPKDEIIISSEHTILEGAFKSKLFYKPNIGVLRFTKDHPLLKETIQKIQLSCKKHTGTDRMMIFTKLIKKHKLLDIVSLPSVYCPVAWWHCKDQYGGLERKRKYGQEPLLDEYILSQSVGIHLWNHHTYLKHNIDFNKIHKTSLFAKLHNLIND